MSVLSQKVLDHGNDLCDAALALLAVAELLVDEDNQHSLTDCQKSGLSRVVSVISKGLFDAGSEIYQSAKADVAAPQDATSSKRGAEGRQ
ncbi:hypothetical protein [Pseudomonas typographi]|uniref:hypothetical protein n=1 Tax=Pseudomonas typographi TaxID=2715964 RepID=UPI00168368A1|nr:hypothetical protein [Pseudomonas typographi]MBD1553599.1 hypothetical protein [Pseudomonas typographi]MBD1589638.1 hypothetical protein [Pseudomonas typographi]